MDEKLTMERYDAECIQRLETIALAAIPVRDSFRAVGADKNGLVKWTVDPIAMRALIVALHDAGKGYNDAGGGYNDAT